MTARWAAIFMMGAALAAGCDRSPARRSGGGRPGASREPQTMPALSPLATRPAPSSLAIAGREAVFPPARIVVLHEQPHLDLLVVSDDPRDALHPSYRGNRYYLSLRVENATLASLVQVEWRARAPSMERRDVPDGIFLDGNRRQLQPYDVRFGLEKQGEELVVAIEGQFTMFDNEQTMSLPQLVPVEGVLRAAVETAAGRPWKARQTPPPGDEQSAPRTTF